MNIFTGEATTNFPTAIQMARGGVSNSFLCLVFREIRASISFNLLSFS